MSFFRKMNLISFVYVFVQLFAAAFPLAPLIALVTNMFDLRLDAKRLLWTNRRPVAYRAEDIGKKDSHGCYTQS
jgi:hypothetical protein